LTIGDLSDRRRGGGNAYQGGKNSLGVHIDERDVCLYEEGVIAFSADIVLISLYCDMVPLSMTCGSGARLDV